MHSFIRAASGRAEETLPVEPPAVSTYKPPTMYIFDCPICRKTVTVPARSDAPFRPFCSYRCKMIDLGKWLSEEYVVSEPMKPEDIDKLGQTDEMDDAGRD